MESPKLRTPESDYFEAEAFSLQLRVTKHKGALFGFALAMLGLVAVGIFSHWYALGRASEVNGPVASGLMGIIALIISSFAWYQSRMVVSTEMYNYYKGLISAGGIIAALSAVAFIGTVIYRDQSGGLNVNGVETVAMMAPLLLVFVIAENIAIRNLRSGYSTIYPPEE